MRTRILSITIALAAFLGNTATTYAQNQSETAGKEKTEQRKGMKRHGNQADGKKKIMKSRNDSVFNPFNGIQLTADQQERLQVLRQGLGPEMPEKKSKEDQKALTEDQKKQMKENRKAKKTEAKKNYLSGVKEILTPDQYIVFLENVYLYTPQSDPFAQGRAPKAKVKKDKKAPVEKN